MAAAGVGAFQEPKGEESKLLGKRIARQPAGEGESAAVVVGAVTVPSARLPPEGVLEQPEGARELVQVPQ